MAHYYLDVNTTAFTPRDFQVELLAAIKEKNVILCLGNSYSKEFIALKAIQEQAHELRKHEPIKNVKQSIKKNTLYITNNGFQSTSSADVGNCGGESIYNSIHYLTDLSVININDKKENAIEWDTLFHTYNVIILSVELCVYALQYGHINFCNINLMIIENCHIKRCITDELANVLRAYEKCSTMKPRLLGLAGPLHSAECSPSRLTAEVEQLEKIVKCKVETASDIVTLLRYSLKPIEIILQCEPANETELTQLLHEQILILKNFIGDHRFDPSETYGSFKEEINKMSDPKLEPLKLIDEYLLALNDLGAWGADRLAFTLIKRIEKLKIKTAYERHFLLLCLTETTLVQIRAICERKFEKLANDKERIQKYSSPKVLRIIEILRLFKVKPVEDSTELNQDVVDHENGTLTNEMNETIPSETVNSLNVEKKKSSKSLQKVNELLAMKKNSSPTSGSPTSVSPTAALHLQFALKPFNRRHGTRFNRITGRTFSMNRYRNINTIDPDALYGIIFCNKDTIAKLLHNLIHTMSKCDKDLSYVCTQFTVGRTANPLTEPKEAETEHRKQEEVLKRFRMHDCNLLIGTSILEQGIDLPKCNLVIRWDPPTTYRSYVQCKGRARATNAFHIIMVTPIINDYQPPSLLKVNHTNDNNDNDDDNDADNPPNVHLSAQSHKLICSESYNLLVNDECSPVHKRRSPSDNLDKIIGDDDDVNDEDDIIIINNNNNNNNKKLTQEKTLKHDPMVSNLMEKYVCVEQNTNDDEKSPSNNKNRKNTQYLINLKNMENCTRQMVEKTAHYKEIEKMLIKKCDNAEPLQKEFILSDKYTGCLEPYKPLSSNPTGPSVNLSTAIALINKYCAKLPSDTFTKLIPLWRCAKTIRLNKKWYQYTIRLPINSPLKQDILGLPMPTRILARRCAALIACRILHQSGELDDSLQPITKEGFRASEPDWEHFELDPNDEQMVSDNLEARPGTTKRRQYYYKKIAAVLSNCRPTANRFAYFYLIKLKLECPIPEEQNTRGRKVYPPEDDVQGFGILTLKEIPKLSAFPIFTRSGEVRVSIELSKQRVYLSETDLQHINTFLNYTFSKVLRLKKYFMVFDKDATENSFYIVPTIKRPTKNKEIKEIIEIDWEFLAGIAKSADDLPMAVSEEERSKTQFDMNKFTDVVVMPWYRNQDQPQYFYVAEICDYLSPESTFPGENYSTFKEYYYLKYNIKIQNANQPLLDVDHTSARLNFLTPRYVNRKGVALPTSSEETKRAKRENLEQKQILVPELCTIHPFPASLWRAAVCLPCILYRINALLLADEIRIQVANEIGLGKVEINDGDFKWPILDFGWSLAEVLKKSRDTRLIRQQQQQQQKQQEQPQSEQPPSIKNKNNIEMVNGMKKANNNKDKQQPPITEQLNGNCDDGVLLIKTANDILEEADKKLKKNSVLEIGMWSNDMLNDINDCDDCEWGLLPPNIKMCSTDKNNIRYGSPTSWDVIDNRNNVSKNYSSNHTVGIDKNTNYYSDSDRSYGSDDSDDDDDDDFDTKSCDSNESNSNKLKIQFKSDNIAEAIETEEDILKQKRQIEIINNINAIKSNGGESEKNYVCGFMGFIDNCAVDVDMDDGKRIKQHELNFKKSIVNFQNYIYNSGMLIKYNQTLNIKDGKRIMAIASNPFHDLIKFDENVENDHPKNADDLDSNCDSVKGDVEDDEVMVDGTPSDDYDDDDRDGDGDDDEDDHYDCDHSEHFKYMDNISNLDKFYDLVSFVDHKIFNEYIKSKTIFTIDDLYALNRLYFEKQQRQEKHQKNGTYETYEIEGTGDLFDNFNDYHNIKIDTISNRKVLTIDIGEFFKERIINKIKDDILLLNDNSLRSNSQPVVVTNAEGQSPFINGFSFDYQPNLIGHYGPCPSVILQGLTMSNANDGINLERLETIGDSFLKYAITTYLYCKYDNVHEGKLSHLRSKQVSNLNLYRLGRRKMLGESMIATKFEPHDNWLPPCYYVPKDLEKRLHESKIPACDWNLSGLSNIKELTTDEIYDLIKHNYTIRKQLEQDVNQENSQEKTTDSDDSSIVNGGGGGGGDGYACFLPYNLVTQHSIPDKSIADCVEALIGSYLIECGPRGALLFMAWLGIRVLPYVEIPVDENYDKNNARFVGSTMPKQLKIENNPTKLTIEDNQFIINVKDSDSDSDSKTTKATKIIYGYWPKPASPLLLYAPNPYEKLELLLDGYDVFENKIGYKFTDRSYLLQAMTHASYIPNRLTDCYQRLEFLGDAVLDYLITRHLYEDARQHNPGSLTDLRSALVNNTIFASLAVRHGFHKYFRHLSPALNEVIDRFVRIQDENGHTISEEFYLRSEEECDEAEDIEVPKSLGDVFESIAGAIYLDSNKSLDTVWKVYYYLMKPEIELFSNSVPKSPIRELLELEPETAKFGKPEKLADGRRVRVSVEVFGKGTFRGIGRNYRIAKCTAAKCALRQLKKLGLISKKH